METALAGTPSVPVSSTESVNNEYFLERLQHTLEVIRSNPRLQREKEWVAKECIERDIARICSPGIQNHFCFIAKVLDATDPDHPKLEYVENLATFQGLLGALEDPEVVGTYAGQDANEVTVLIAPLPQNYVARVAWVRFRHIPEAFKADGRVVLREISSTSVGDNHLQCILACRDMDMPWTDMPNRNISFQEMHRNYHCLTIKVNNGDGTIKSWNPGMDPDMAPCMSMQDMFVRVGHFNPKPQANQHSQPHHQGKKNRNRPGGDPKTNGLAKIPLN